MDLALAAVEPNQLADAIVEIHFLAQAHWHHFHYRIGELIGLDRGKREVHLAPHADEEGNEVTPAAVFPTIRWSSPWAARAMTPVLRRREHAISLDTPPAGEALPQKALDAYIRGHAQ